MPETKTRSPRKQTDAQFEAELAAATAREAAEYDAGMRAVAAHYDHATKRVVLELSNGTAFAFPAKIVRGLEKASSAQRAALELSPSGSGIIWDALDADISVPGILSATFRRAGLAMMLGRAGGEAKSKAKSKASRANGKKGGRPRSSAVTRQPS